MVCHRLKRSKLPRFLSSETIRQTHDSYELWLLRFQHFNLRSDSSDPSTYSFHIGSNRRLLSSQRLSCLVPRILFRYMVTVITDQDGWYSIVHPESCIDRITSLGSLVILSWSLSKGRCHVWFSCRRTQWQRLSTTDSWITSSTTISSNREGTHYKFRFKVEEESRYGHYLQ